MRGIIEFFKKPFPQEERFVDTVKIVAAISVFVVLFLLVFQPFGLHLIESGLLLLCLGFGAVAFVTSLLYECLVVFAFKFKGTGRSFSFGRWVVYFTGAILIISLANFIFVRLVLFDDIQWQLYPSMLRGTFAIAIFPVVVVGALALLKQEQKYQSIAAAMNNKPPQQTSTDGVTLFNLPVSSVRYVEAMQNYINIHYLNAAGHLQMQTERATIKALSTSLQGTAIVRCHRSYLVNRDAIINTAGNAQGLLLQLADCEQNIPVSRSYVAAFRSG